MLTPIEYIQLISVLMVVMYTTIAITYMIIHSKENLMEIFLYTVVFFIFLLAINAGILKGIG